MKKKEQILSLWGTTNPKTGKPWSKLGISKKVKVSRTYVYKVLQPLMWSEEYEKVHKHI